MTSYTETAVTSYTETAAAFALDYCHTVARKWLGAEYDLDTLNATLATVAVERLTGDPLWLLVLSGSGNAKTETVGAMKGAGAHMTSTISSLGALLSATAKREQSKDATGGLLRELGDRGVLVIKDVTSILSISRDTRAEILGALREVYDGSWTRKVGTDGGKSLHWSGRLAVIGAVTTAWDQAHEVVASMGDRFVIIRADSSKGRLTAGRQAIRNTGSEEAMRSDLQEAAAAVITNMDKTPTDVAGDEEEQLLAAADLVTRCRTAVMRDYRGDVIDAHAMESPTRFAKQLAQVLRGAVAIGMSRTDALRLALRCARDSMPPLRLLILEDVAEHPRSTATDVRKRINKPRATVDRELQALHMLEVMECTEEEAIYGAREVTRWFYSVSSDVDPGSISLPDLALPTPRPQEGDLEEGSLHRGSAISGKGNVHHLARLCSHCHTPMTANDGRSTHPACINTGEHP